MLYIFYGEVLIIKSPTGCNKYAIYDVLLFRHVRGGYGTSAQLFQKGL